MVLWLGFVKLGTLLSFFFVDALSSNEELLGVLLSNFIFSDERGVLLGSRS